MKSAIVLAVALVLVVTANGHAPDGRDNTLVLGSGSQDCRLWLKAREAPDSPLALVMVEWVNGFLTGIQVGASLQAGSRIVLSLRGAEDLESRVVWLEDYCQNHPQDQLSTAASRLFVALLDSRALGRLAESTTTPAPHRPGRASEAAPWLSAQARH